MDETGGTIMVVSRVRESVSDRTTMHFFVFVPHTQVYEDGPSFAKRGDGARRTQRKKKRGPRTAKSTAVSHTLARTEKRDREGQISRRG